MPTHTLSRRARGAWLAALALSVCAAQAQLAQEPSGFTAKRRAGSLQQPAKIGRAHV